MFNPLLKAILAVVYFLVIVPFGAVTRLFSDPLRIRRRGTSNWVPRPAKAESIETARRIG